VIFVIPCKGGGWIVLCEYGHLEPIVANASFASFANFSIIWGWENSTVRELAIVGWTKAPPNSFMDSTMSPKGEQRKDKELGHAPWLITLWGWRGMLELQDGN